MFRSCLVNECKGNLLKKKAHNVNDCGDYAKKREMHLGEETFLKEYRREVSPQ